MTVENETSALAFSGEGTDAILDLNLFYIRQIGASLRKHVGIQDKLEREIKLRDGASRMLGACTHEDQLLEVAKTLHTSNARMYTYMAELQKLKTAEIMEKAMDEEGIQNELKVCTGRVAISDIRIPLIWNDPERYTGAKVKEASRYAVFCLVRVGGEVQDTELVCTDKTTTDVSFRDVLVFENAAHSFKMDVEIFAFPMSEESISAQTPQKLLSKLNRSIGKSEGKRIRDRLKDNPASSMKSGPQYEKLGCLTLDLSCVNDHIRSHNITRTIAPSCTTTRTRPLLPLYESLTCRLVAQPRCITEKCITGFLQCMDVDHGMPCWSYMWCEVRAGRLRCWLNPEDSAEKKSQNSIHFIGRDIRINEIEKNRQKRANSFQVRDLTERHIFSACSKEEMTNWIKNLRQHRSDYSAWSIACVPEKNGVQSSPMFIASPALYKSPSHLLFDASVRKTLIYEQMSMESPSKSDSEIIEVSDMLKKVDASPQSVGMAMIEANQPSLWTGLFSGALNKSLTKVTKLKDVQNIDSHTAKKTSRSRTKSCDVLSTSGKPSKQKKDHQKPPLPRRPSNEILNDRKKRNVKSTDLVKPFPKIESLKSCHTSESCSETGLSDFCQSSDDVFLSSDENLLDSSSKNKKSLQTTPLSRNKGRKKRRAPQPPPNLDCTLNESSNTMGTRSRSKASLSSASSLDDILESRQDLRKSSHPVISFSQVFPHPSPGILRAKGTYIQDSDPDGRQSQLSLASNSTQVSNTSSGYKSDSEGLLTISVSSLSHDKLVSGQSDCEVLVTEREVKSNRKGLTGIKVLPTNLSLEAKRTPYKYSRSHSWDSDAVLRSDTGPETHSSDEASRLRFCSTPPSVPRRLAGKPPPLPKPNSASKIKTKNVTQTLSSKTFETPTGMRPPFPRPIPTPRRSYLTAVESNKVRSQPALLRDIPDSPYSEIEIPGLLATRNGKTYSKEDIYAIPIPKALRSTNNNNASDSQEPVYATVDKSRKYKPASQKFEIPRRVGVDAYTKAHKAIITVCKQRMEEENARRNKSVADDDVVYV